VLKREIERFGGTVEKFIGDAVMAVFGAPVAHEDDAKRAVRAALRITEAIAELNQSNPDLDLSIRAAVNTGEGLVNLSARPQAGEGMVTGDVVNTASRLQNIAPVNGVVVGEITYRSTMDFIVYEDMDPVIVKGKPEPIRVWRAISAKSRFGVDFRHFLSTPLVARDYELGAIKNSYFRSLRESSVQLITVIGEPGVGKSRLVAEFWKFIDQEQPELLISWRQGRCLPYGEGITFWALGEVVKAHAGILDSDNPDEASEKLRLAVRALVHEPSDADWITAWLAPLVGASRSSAEKTERSESFTAWRRFLEAIAAQDPFVLVFEDLHWADEALLEFIDHLVEWSTGVRLLVLCTARPELYDKHRGWGGGKRNSNIFALSPLADGEVSQLISALLSEAVLPAEIHSAVLERAGGNPLYTEEFVRMLMDQGVFARGGRVLKLRPGADVTVPESLQALIAARLDTLPPDLKSTLQDAAVVGKVFWSDAVCSLSGLDDHIVRMHLHELVKRELLRPHRESSIKDESEYSFWHLLVRDVTGKFPDKRVPPSMSQQRVGLSTSLANASLIKPNC
jgi:hypothetical protein